MKIKNGIILAGGAGSRLMPLTSLFNKHLVPLNNKFIIDYPIDTLKSIGIENLTVVLGGEHFSQVVSHLKDGNHLGMNINYIYQREPSGIAQAINLCKSNVLKGVNDPFAVILGDNIFENEVKFTDSGHSVGAQIVLHDHKELNRFGVATLGEHKQIIKIEEKPKSVDYNFENYAITGCYMFDCRFFSYFNDIKPSARGEYEITDIIKKYHNNGLLNYTFSSGLWSDAGTHESLRYVSNYLYNKI